MSSTRLLPHALFLAAGLALGLRLALPTPLDAEGVATIGLCLVLARLVGDAVLARLPEWLVDAPPGTVARSIRARARGHAAIEADEAATWAVLPPPRRSRPRPEVTVAAVTGGPPQLRAVGPLDRPTAPEGRGVRVVAARSRGRGCGGATRPDRETLTACWDAASRRSARLVDAVAVDLGLARDELRPAPAADPDPLLTAATWATVRRAA